MGRRNFDPLWADPPHSAQRNLRWLPIPPCGNAFPGPCLEVEPSDALPEPGIVVTLERLEPVGVHGEQVHKTRA
jgi:hypothetical protein